MTRIAGWFVVLSVVASGPVEGGGAGQGECAVRRGERDRPLGTRGEAGRGDRPGRRQAAGRRDAAGRPGLAGNLSRKMLAASLGPEVKIAVEGRALVLTVDAALLTPERRGDWERRVRDLAREAEREARRRIALRHARAEVVSAQRPDAADGLSGPRGELVVGRVRPHGPRRSRRRVTGSSSSTTGSTGAWKSRAGCSRATGRRSGGRRASRGRGRWWRTRWGRWWRGITSRGRPIRTTSRPWSMIAPVNQGSHLAQTQTILQLLNGVQAVNGRRTSDALAHLGDGLGRGGVGHDPGERLPQGAERPAAAARGWRITSIAGDVGLLAAARGGRSRGGSRRRSGRAGSSAGSPGSRPARPLGPARRVDRRHRRRLRLGRPDPARRRRRPRRPPRQPRRADPRPPALRRPGAGRVHARPAAVAGRRGKRPGSQREQGIGIERRRSSADDTDDGDGSGELRRGTKIGLPRSVSSAKSADESLPAGL